MESKLLTEIQRYDSVRNVGYQYLSCFNRDVEPTGNMVHMSNAISMTNDYIQNLSNPNIFENKSMYMKSSLLDTVSNMTTNHMVTENTSVLYVCNLPAMYEILKGLRRGLGTKSARKLLDKTFYKGAFDDILEVTKYTKGKK